MKFFALACMLAVATFVNGDEPAKNGTACEKATDPCGDITKSCCGVATGGQMCKEPTCEEGSLVKDIPVPNFVVCNDRTNPASFVITQQNKDATQSIYMHFPGTSASFACLETPSPPPTEEAEQIIM